MEGCSKRTAGAESGIPDGPLLDILSRVPAKSVCRFKCVSKTWSDLIDDPDNRKKLRQPMQGLFVKTRASFEAPSFSFIDIDLTVRSVPLDIDRSFSFLTEIAGTETIIFDSCNGLILFGLLYDPGYYTVCNSTTKEWSTVPACGSGELVTYAYLAFAPELSSHFHLIQFQMREKIVSLHVYSSETGTWSQNQIGEQKEQGQLEGWHHQFTLDTNAATNLWTFVNGFLHVIIRRSGLQRILVLDLQGKAKRMIDVPRPEDSFVCYLGQSQGHLHCVTRLFDDGEISTWVLQDYDTQEWVLKNTVDLNSLDIFGETQGMPELDMVDIHQDCNVVFFLHNYDKLAAYDMDRKEASLIATFKDLKDPWDFVRYVPYFPESPDLKNKCVLYV